MMILNIFTLPTNFLKGILSEDTLLKHIILPKISDTLSQAEFTEIINASKKPNEIRRSLAIINNTIENAIDVDFALNKLKIEYKSTVASGKEVNLEDFLRSFNMNLRKEGKIALSNKATLALNLITDENFLNKCQRYLDKKKSIEDFAKYSNINISEEQFKAIFDFLEHLAKDQKYNEIKLNGEMDEAVLMRTLLLTQDPLAVNLHKMGLLAPVTKFVSYFGYIKPDFINNTIKTKNANFYIYGMINEIRKLMITDLEFKRKAIRQLAKQINMLIEQTNEIKFLYAPIKRKRLVNLKKLLDFAHKLDIKSTRLIIGRNRVSDGPKIIFN
jgi:hypothetical protein